MKHGHVTYMKKEHPMTERERANLEALATAVWSTIHSEQDLAAVAAKLLAATMDDAAAEQQWTQCLGFNPFHATE